MQSDTIVPPPQLLIPSLIIAAGNMDNQPATAVSAATSGVTNNDTDVNNTQEQQNNNDVIDLLSADNIQQMSISLDDFMTAIQDPGRMGTKGRQQGKMLYPKLDKIAAMSWKKLLTKISSKKNATEAKRALVQCLEMQRNHIDIVEALPSLRMYAIPEEEKMYVFRNDESGGQDLFLELCVTKYHKPTGSNSKRDGNDAIRVCAAICHPSVREGAVNVLSGKKSRNQLDQSNNTYTAFFETVLEVFLDSDLEIPRPDVMDLDNHDPNNKLDPMHYDYKNKNVNAEWVSDTWFSYTKPKLKKAYGKWWMETGGGPRTLDNILLEH